MAEVSQAREMSESSKQFQRGKRFLHPTRRTEIIAYSWSSTLPSFIVLQNFDGNPFNDLIAHKDPQQKTLWIPALFHRRKVTRSQVSQQPPIYLIPRENFHLEKFYFLFSNAQCLTSKKFTCVIVITHYKMTPSPSSV